jgi:hypothetical protein
VLPVFGAASFSSMEKINLAPPQTLATALPESRRHVRGRFLSHELKWSFDDSTVYLGTF